MKKTFGLLGEKLTHSFSPRIHSELGDYEYPLYEIPNEGFDDFMTQRRFDGINVTIPYKQAVIPYCSSLSNEARLAGSVNTIIKEKDGSLHGHNTDYPGFCVMLEKGKIDPKGKKILVLGNGGSAASARTALAFLGAKEIITVSRKGENNYENISRHHDAQIIVNTTPVGMYPDNGKSPLNLDGFVNLTGVVDLIYNPMKTKLLLDAQRLNIPCVNGLAMLVSQAEMASRVFIKKRARPQLVERIIKNLVKEKQNIALIGMPGCGKSSVGKILADKMKREFVDTDEQIVKTQGKTIKEIFADDGENAFRTLESSVLSQESKKSGIVISLGGGIVTRQENLDLLRQNSLIVYLKRSLEELSTDGRPLSQSIGVEALAKQRLPLYEEWSDISFQVQENPLKTASCILDYYRKQ